MYGDSQVSLHVQMEHPLSGAGMEANGDSSKELVGDFQAQFFLTLVFLFKDKQMLLGEHHGSHILPPILVVPDQLTAEYEDL